jgi:hypothetical protein
VRVCAREFDSESVSVSVCARVCTRASMRRRRMRGGEEEEEEEKREGE